MPSVTLVDTTSTQTVAGKTLTAPAITSGVLSSCTASANPTVSLGLATKQYVDALNFGTGDVKLSFKSTADSGWVMMNDGTIGSSSSSATTRANADTQALFELLWNNVSDTWAPVVGGRGGSAAADFAANKQLRLPRMLGRALAGTGAAVTTATGVNADVNISTDTFTVPSNTATWITGMAVLFTLSSGTITGLTSGVVYFVVRASTTTINLATTLANAQNNVTINLTATSSPVWTLACTTASRALGENVGETAHAQSSTELLAHDHNTTAGANVAGGVFAAGGDKGLQSISSTTVGGNNLMNIMQPTTFVNVMIRL